MKHGCEKIKNFQRFLREHKLQAFMVTELNSVNYLADFTFAGQNDAYLMITQSKAYCFTKELYAITLRKAAPYLTLINSLKYEDMAQKAKELKIKAGGFDPALSDYIGGNTFKALGFKEMAGVVSKLRAQKLPSEVKRIKKACEISSKAYAEFKKNLKPGISEQQAAQMLNGIMTRLGGHGLAFDTIVAFGENGANPHAQPSGRKLKREEAVLIDYGCKFEGYCSDITRAFWFGKKPSAEFKKIYAVVKGAHDAAVKAAKPGMIAGDLDAAARGYIQENSGLAKHFVHTLGHGLGLYIHEAPRVAVGSGEILREGSVFTIEPGLYFEGKLGIRYENTILLTKKGVKFLTINKE
jgi:Xaa-Pro aminopeptidase